MKHRQLPISLALIMSLAAAPASAGDDTDTWCIALASFCDSVTLNVGVEAGQVSGTWHNNDCSGNSSPVSGNRSAGNAQMRIKCLDATCPAGKNHLFIFKSAERVFDLLRDGGSGIPLRLQIDEPFAFSPGACSINQAKHADPNAEPAAGKPDSAATIANAPTAPETKY